MKKKIRRKKIKIAFAGYSGENNTGAEARVAMTVSDLKRSIGDEGQNAKHAGVLHILPQATINVVATTNQDKVAPSKDGTSFSLSTRK